MVDSEALGATALAGIRFEQGFQDDGGFLLPFKERTQLAPNAIFATFEGEQISVAILDAQSDVVANALRDLGVQPGDRAAVMMQNSPGTLAVMFGLAKAGIVWVPVNVQLRGEGLRYILEHCEPALVISDESFIQTLRENGVSDAARLVTLTALLPAQVATSEMNEPFKETLPAPETTFAIMYTSGTTGPPKGVMVSHRMMRLAGEAVRHISDARSGDVFFVWEPLFHIGGAQLIVLPALYGITLAMVGRFSASSFWDDVREARASHIHYLGGVLQILLKQPGSPLDRDHNVRIAWGGGCQKEIWRAFEERYGIPLRECYGMTEASSITTCNRRGVVGAVGLPMPWFEFDIRDENDRLAGPNQSGEIVVRPLDESALFKGYFRDPEATAKALRNGCLYTGDIGSVGHDGLLRFHGRKTDSVRCRGENVSAWEVEHVAATHPDVEECAMIGVKTDVGEQDIKLFLKLKENSTLELPAFSKWLGERLATYQNPRYLSIVQDFDRTPSRRIMKHKLSTETTHVWDRRVSF